MKHIYQVTLMKVIKKTPDFLWKHLMFNNIIWLCAVKKWTEQDDDIIFIYLFAISQNCFLDKIN